MTALSAIITIIVKCARQQTRNDLDYVCPAETHTRTHPDRVLHSLAQALHQPNRPASSVGIATDRPPRRVAVGAAPPTAAAAAGATVARFRPGALGHDAKARPQARQVERRRAGAAK